jgi:hypothetical protein
VSNSGVICGDMIETPDVKESTNVKSVGKILGSSLMDSETCNVTKNHYKIHEGDSVCVRLEIGSIWKMFVDNEHRGGILMKAKYISIFGRGNLSEVQNMDDDSEDIELEPTDMF